MTWRTTEVLSTVREVADEPRTIEGIAVPYGIVSGETEYGREVFAPGAFRASVEHWMSRADGARMAFRPAHKEKPAGSVVSLRDTPEGVQFKAKIWETPAGDEYLAQVREGLNGVSIEAGGLAKAPRRLKDGTALHREATMHAIAGSVSPAYDGARIALRDMEAAMNETPAPDPTPDPPPPVPAPEPEPDKAIPQIPQAERDALERGYMAGRMAGGGGPLIRITRAEAVYSPFSEYSYIQDAYRSQMKGDSAAGERQERHGKHLADIAVQIERAGDVLSTEIPGAYPNDYLPGLLTPRILKGRPMGGFYNRVPISDPRPKIFAKVTTSTTVAVQSAEGANPAASDLATTSVTATPLLYGAETVVSRQALDGGDPSAQSMIMQDMIEAYAQASETVIKTAVEAGSTASGTAITAATPFAGLVGNIVAYQAARFTPAEGQFIPPALYSVALAQADTTGRMLLPSINPFNAQGTTKPGAVGASILNSDEFLSWASTVNVVVTGRPSDFVIYESSIASFSFDAVTGPSGVRIGIWAYLVVGTRLGSLKVTAA